MHITKESLVSKIKKKKELAGLADNIILEYLDNYLIKRNISLDSLRPSDTKIIIKAVRAGLRTIAGRFQKNTGERQLLLKKGNVTALLKTHSSTHERLPHYPLIKRILRRLNVKSVLDLGCGLNPLALASPGIRYYAIDIKEDELSIIRQFFEKNKIHGQAIAGDIRKMLHFPKADICIIFKVLDILETKGHKIAEEILKKLECAYVLISFSTKTLSGRPMNHPQRGWLERLSGRLGYSWKLIKAKNELFYLINRNC